MPSTQKDDGDTQMEHKTNEPDSCKQKNGELTHLIGKQHVAINSKTKELYTDVSSSKWRFPIKAKEGILK